MSTIDWPDALVPQTCQLALRKSGQQFASPFNGTTQALDFIAERWVLSVSLAQMAARNPRGVGSFCNRLAGGVERVRGWNFGHNRGVPMGTLRGTPTLSASLVRGDVALPVAGAVAGVNLLRGGGFEVDTNADGVADAWAAYTTTAGPVTRALYSGVLLSPEPGLNFQSVNSAALNGAAGCISDGVAVAAGGSYTASAAMAATTGAACVISIAWKDVGGTYISESQASHSAALGRRSVTAVAPVGATSAQVVVFAYSVAGTAVDFSVDNAQLQLGAVASPFAGMPTLRADDMLGAGGQLFQVASDVTLSDMGAGSVPVINRVRSAISSGAAVLWNRPTAEFILPAMQAGPVYRPGAIESAALDLVEVWG